MIDRNDHSSFRGQNIRIQQKKMKNLLIYQGPTKLQQLFSNICEPEQYDTLFIKKITNFFLQIKYLQYQINLQAEQSKFMGNQKSVIESCKEFMQNEENSQTVSYGEKYSTAPIEPSAQKTRRKIKITQSSLFPTILAPMKEDTININRLVYSSQLITNKITNSLDHLIMERRPGNQYFQHNTIISLINCLMKTFQVCYDSNIPYSHFHPRNINYSGHFQVLNPILIPLPQNNRPRKQVPDDTSCLYLSPQIKGQILLLKKNYKEIPVDIRHRSDLFAIGCTILEACTLTPSHTIYHCDGSIIDAKVDEKLRVCLDKYHPSISQFLSMIIKLKNNGICGQAIKFHRQRLSNLMYENKVEQKITQSPTRKVLPHFSSIRNTSKLKPVSVIPECSEASRSYQISKQISPRYLGRIDSEGSLSKKESGQQNIITSD